MFPKNLKLVYFFLIFSANYVSAQINFSKVDAEIEKNKRSLSKNLVVLIYKDGKIIYKKETGSFTSKTQEPIASCSKWLTAALVMTFVDEGKLSLDDKVSKYLPAFNFNGKQDITIRHCLSQQTGIHQEPFRLFRQLTKKKYKTLEEEVDDFANKSKLDYASGSGFYYGNVGLNIAARVVEVITKKNFSTLMKERIFKPLEMNNSRFDDTEKAPNPSGSAISTADDYMNFLIMLLNKGEFKNKRILSEKAVASMEQTQTALDRIKYAPKVAEGYNYALGSWVQEADNSGKPTVLTCPGLFGTWPLIDNCRGYACIFFVKGLLGEQKAETYVAVKKQIDAVIPSNCK